MNALMEIAHEEKEEEYWNIQLHKLWTRLVLHTDMKLRTNRDKIDDCLSWIHLYLKEIDRIDAHFSKKSAAR